MSWRRASAAVSVVLLWLLVIAVAEAALAALLFLFALVLKLNLGIQVGPEVITAFVPPGAYPDVSIYDAASVGSFLFTALCGVATAVWTFRRWRPVR